MMSTNSDDHTVFSGKICDVLIPFWTSPGFAIPIIKAHDKGNTRYIQRVDKEGIIIKFDVISAAQSTRPVENPIGLELGFQERFAIVEPSKSCIIGTKEELKALVKNWLYDLENPSIRLNFAAFCDDYACGRDALKQLLAEKKKEFGSQDAARRWFISSYIFLDVLKIILDNAYSNMQSSRNIGQVRITIGRTQCIAFFPTIAHNNDFEAFSGAGDTFFSRLLMQSLNKDRLHFNVSSQKSKKHSDLDKSIDDQIYFINLHKRQEARLAAILALILADSKLGVAVLRAYHDRARFAQASKHLILRNATSKEKFTDIAAAKILQSMLQIAHPRQTGIFLLEMSKQLYLYRNVAAFIRDTATRSNSMSISALKRDILYELDRERRPM